jgi:hypothetical protein
MANLILIERDPVTDKGKVVSTFTTKTLLWEYMLPKLTDTWDLRTPSNDRLYALNYPSMCNMIKKFPVVFFRDNGKVRFTIIEAPKNLKPGEE